MNHLTADGSKDAFELFAANMFIPGANWLYSASEVLKTMSKNHFGIGGKGYYIALILCASAIGITGYVYQKNARKEAVMETVAVTEAAVTTPVVQQEEIPVIAPTQPSGTTVPTETITPRETTPAKLKTAAPLDGEALAGYAVDCLTYNQTTRDWRTHDGVDLAAEAGTPVCAAADGTVSDVREDDALGYVVTVTHAGGYETRYACLAQDVSVGKGDTVRLGQQLGTVGETALLESALGAHLHFQVSCQGKSVDPQEFLNPAS